MNNTIDMIITMFFIGFVVSEIIRYIFSVKTERSREKIIFQDLRQQMESQIRYSEVINEIMTRKISEFIRLKQKHFDNNNREQQ